MTIQAWRNCPGLPGPRRWGDSNPCCGQSVDSGPMRARSSRSNRVRRRSSGDWLERFDTEERLNGLKENIMSMLRKECDQQALRSWDPERLWGSCFAAAIEDPPVIVKILAHLGLPPAPRHAPLRSDSIYSRQSEEPKTGCQREPTAPLALSSSERRDPAHFARLRPLRRPSRPKQHRDFHQTERRLTSHRSGDIAQARKKGGLK